MYPKILVPIDGSATSRAGLEEAVKLAQGQGSELRLFHVVNELILDQTYGGGMYATNLIEALREAGEKTLKDAEAYVRQRGVRVETALQESIGGPAAALILAHAAEWGADLIVMGTHGRRGLRRLALGSDAESVVREAPVPVLLVRSDTPRSRAGVPSAAMRGG